MRIRFMRIILMIVSLTVVTLLVPAAQMAYAAPHADTIITNCTFDALKNAVASGGTITFNCGTQPVTIAVTSTLMVGSVTTIDGSNLITLDGGGTTRLITNNSTLTVKNLRFSRGYSSGINAAANGGAIQSVYQSTLTVVHCQFDNNIADPSVTSTNAYDYGGGAIFTQGGVLTVSDSTFTSNLVRNGSGGAIHGLRSDLIISNTTFSNNRSASSADGVGGAMYADGALPNNHGQIMITGSSFISNTTRNQGGAVHIYMYQNNDATTIDRTVFANNSVTDGLGLGGGLKFGNGQLTITNSLFVGNSVRGGNSTNDGSGGAIAVTEPAVVTVANSTLTGNKAYGSSYNANGGAFYIANNVQPFTFINSTIANNYAGWVGGGITGGPGILKNTLVANNTADNGPNHWGILQQCSTKLTNGGNNLQWPPKNPNTNFYNETVCADNLIVQDPQLAPLADNGGWLPTLAVPASSPAVGAGSSTTCQSAPINNVDQRGFTRLGAGNTTCAVGACERTSQGNPAYPHTIGIYRQGVFYLRNANSTGFADLTIPYSPVANGYPVVGDWTGRGVDSIGVYDRGSGAFYLRDSNTPGQADHFVVLGIAGDEPLAGRWQANATHAGVGVFRPSNGLIYLKNELTTGFADYTMVLGIPGDVGLAGDWNGDDVDSPGVYRPNSITFYLSDRVTTGSVIGDYALQLGILNDVPIAGRWQASATHAGVGVFRPSNGLIYLKNELTTGFAETTIVFGVANDIPVVGRWTPQNISGSSPSPQVSDVPNLIIPDVNVPPTSVKPPPTLPTSRPASSYDG